MTPAHSGATALVPPITKLSPSSGVVLSGSYGDGYHLGWLLTEGFEVGRNVFLAKAASEFDDADGLIGCSNAIRKLVEFSDLDRRIGDIASGVGTG